jgi:cell division septum initiation protein DivIVA
MRRKNVGLGRGADEPKPAQEPDAESERDVPSSDLETEVVVTSVRPMAADLARGGMLAEDSPLAAAEDSPAAGEDSPAAGEHSAAATAAAEKVASIVEAAENAAADLRREAEDRVRARIAEADRGADNRVKAAEEEAAETLSTARKEAAKLRKDAKAEADRLVSEATSKGLEVAGRAQEEADRMLAEAAQEAEKLREDVAGRARELMRHAEETASEINHEGFHMVGNLRELGDSLRTNAERLIKDVQTIHTRMTAQIERVRDEAGPPPRPRRASETDGEHTRPSRAGRDAPTAPPDDDELDVPEFVPPR